MKLPSIMPEDPRKPTSKAGAQRVEGAGGSSSLETDDCVNGGNGVGDKRKLSSSQQWQKRINLDRRELKYNEVAELPEIACDFYLRAMGVKVTRKVAAYPLARTHTHICLRMNDVSYSDEGNKE